MSTFTQRLLVEFLAIVALFFIPIYTYAQTDERLDASSTATAAAAVVADDIVTTDPGTTTAVPAASKHFQWQGATRDSARFLLLQTAARLSFQDKTRDGLTGPFVKDYFRTVRLRPLGFMDGDSWYTNLVGHPVQGATAYHIARFRGASRHQAFWWGVAYSTHFELGPLGEAGIGNVRVSPVDLLLTPSAGFLVGATEEWLFGKLSGVNSKLATALRFSLAGRRLSRLIAGK